MAEREFLGTDPEQRAIAYTIQVSGKRVYLHRNWQEDDEEGEGQSPAHECWVMSLADLKAFVANATEAMQQAKDDEVLAEKARWLRNQRDNGEE